TAGLRGELFDQFLRAADEVTENLPPALARVAGEVSSVVVSPVVNVDAIEVPVEGGETADDGEAPVLEPVTWEGTRDLQVFSLGVGIAAEDLVRVVDGTLPARPGPAVSER